ncbi:transcription factor transcription repressor [Musa troglodytarum]|uniref:Transcription factor transcription repressor n=1 Tax=Musa troglodytarum TaxID=320322 RepID=A0A9E7JGB9_9LILI|nr:transcription factor transcription repressor [Musa troglodytarum]
MERKQDGDTRLACRKEDKEREMDLKTLLLKELVEGQESTTQLHTVLQDMLPPNGGSASAAATLMIRILSSFSQAISLLDVQGTVHGLPNARFPDEQRLAASGNKRKLLPQPRKSGYRRRSYFRCGHKYDRGCQATRQVQRSEEDPSTFVITYMGQHACAGGSTPPGPPSPCVISFGSNTCAATAAQERLFPSPISSRDSEVPSNPTPWTSSTELTFADLPLCFDSVSMVTPGCHSSADAFNSEFNPEPLEFGGVFCFGQGELLPQR